MVTFGNAAPIEIRCKVNSSNPELTTTLTDNTLELQIPFIVETDLVIRGWADQPLYNKIFLVYHDNGATLQPTT